MQEPIPNHIKLRNLVPNGSSVLHKDERPVTTLQCDEYNYEIGRNLDGCVTAIFHRNLKTGEAKL